MNRKMETPDRRPGQHITEDTPLTVIEQKFVQNYIKCGSATQALKDAGVKLPRSRNYVDIGYRLLRQPNVEAEVRRIMNEIRDETIADAKEVMTYFTKVMRGEEKDQFGLEAPLSERTKAAQELAKRTVDIENRRNGTADQKVEIKLDWSRD